MTSLFRQEFAKSTYILLAVIAIVVSIYLPGLSGPFVFDDYQHIINNPSIAIDSLTDFNKLYDASTYNKSDLLKRPLPALSLAINYYFSDGLQTAFPFKVTNLLIHVFNTFIVYVFSILLVRQFLKKGIVSNTTSVYLPVLIAALWALHPIQLTSVLYVTQRMTSLSATFVFAGLSVFLYGRYNLTAAPRKAYIMMTIGLLGGLGLGLLCKENAVLILPLALTLEFLLFAGENGDSVTKPQQRRLMFFYAGIVIMPLLLGLLWLILNPEYIFGPYSNREFTLYQRILTEPRIIWFYIKLFLFPSLDSFGLYHDDIPVSTGIFAPWTTFPALIGIALAAGLSLLYGRRYPVIALPVLWFLIGHGLESSFIGLEIAHEHRNYLPSFGIALLLAFLLLSLRNYISRKFVLISTVSIICIFSLTTFLRSYTWQSDEVLIKSMVMHHPSSSRSQYMLAELYAVKYGDPYKAVQHYAIAWNLDPSTSSNLIKIAATIPITNTKPDNSSLYTPIKYTLIKIDGKKLAYFDIFIVSRKGKRPTRRLNPVIHKKIKEQLSHAAISATTLSILDWLYTCQIAEKKPCRSIYRESIEWFSAALANPKLRYNARKNFLTYIAHILFENGDYRQAINFIENNINKMRENHTLRLIEANSHIKINNLGKAEKILRNLRSSKRTLSPEIIKDVNILLEAIKKRRNIIHKRKSEKWK